LIDIFRQTWQEFYTPPVIEGGMHSFVTFNILRYLIFVDKN
jgi:hypothetical protein